MLNKRLSLFFAVIALNLFNLSAKEILSTKNNGIGIVVEQYTPAELQSDPELKKIGQSAPGHFITLISLTGLPKKEIVKFISKRPMLTGVKHFAKAMLPAADTIGKKHLKKLEKITDEVEGMLVADGEGNAYLGIQGAGYMPGEEVEYSFLSHNSKIYDKVTIIPQPIHATSESGKLSVAAKLISLTPTNYEICLKGVSGEKIVFHAASYEEKMEHPLVSTGENKIYYSPDVIGKEGGLAKLSFQNSSKESVSFTLPWGKDLWEYAGGKMVYTPTGPKRGFVSNAN